MSSRNAVTPRAIEHTPGVAGGSARLGETRIPVWLIVHWAQTGLATWQIRKQYEESGITDADIEAALAYARDHKEEIDSDLAKQDSEEDFD